MSLYIQLHFSDESATPVTKKREGVGKAKGRLGFAAAFSNKKQNHTTPVFAQI